MDKFTVLNGLVVPLDEPSSAKTITQPSVRLVSSAPAR